MFISFPFSRILPCIFSSKEKIPFKKSQTKKKVIFSLSGRQSKSLRPFKNKKNKKSKKK